MSECESCKYGLLEGCSCGSCDAQQIMVPMGQDCEDIRNAINIVLDSERHKDSPDFRRSLKRIDKMIHSQMEYHNGS